MRSDLRRPSPLAVFGLAALVAAPLGLAACAPRPQVYEVTEVDRPPDVMSDSLRNEAARARIRYVQPAFPRPSVAPERSVDILDTKLDLSFDFGREAVLGVATHLLTPLRDSLDQFELHAVGMEIDRVDLLPGPLRPRPTAGPTFEYDSLRIRIAPAEPLRLGRTYAYQIAYTAFPMQGGGKGELFNDGKGLYFIDAAGTDPYRPTQLWTQGEAEDNRRWFPTWDYPNDRMTFTIGLTLPDSLVSTSNGVLVSQESAGDGLRTDTWRLDQTQVPYLASLSVGPYAVVEEDYVRPDSSVVPLAYLVEPAYEDEVEAIFGETDDMLRVFEDFLMTPYPWPNYKQVAVRDFTAGGMENTTTTTLFEGIQTDDRARLDYDGRDLIAHELAHQWFGDLVTTRNWANLALNESFASYLEYVYREKTRGLDAEQEAAYTDRQAYLQQAEALRRPIIWYGYDNPGQLFDRHTYQKGGQILRLLRFELGDQDFRRGLQAFLEDYAFETAEMDDLRRSMEQTTGRNLERFFGQWFESPGHPVFSVDQGFFGGSKVYTVQVAQTQDQSNVPVFHTDALIELHYKSAPVERHRVRIASADTTFRFNVTEKPQFVRFNAGGYVLAEQTVRKSLDEWVAQATQADELWARLDAVDALTKLDSGPDARRALLAAAGDAQPLVRKAAVRGLDAYFRSEGVLDRIAAIATDDADSGVRRAAVETMAAATSTRAGEEAEGVVRRTLGAALNDPSYQVAAAAVEAYADRFPESAWAAYAPLYDVRSWRGVTEIALIQAANELNAAAAADWLEARTGQMNGDNVRVAATAAFVSIAVRQGDPMKDRAGDLLADLLYSDRKAVRLAAAQAIAAVGNEAALEALEARAAEETEAEVQAALDDAVEQLKKGDEKSERTVLGR